MNERNRSRPQNPDPTPSPAEVETARDDLRRLLNHRPRSRWEVVQRLQHRGHVRETIEAVLSEAEALDLIDDARFARLWVEDRLQTRPRGKQALRRELNSKGISPEIIDRVLAEVELDESTLIRKLAEERLVRYGKEPPESRYRKVIAFLIRRGFPSGEVREVVRDLIFD